MRIGVNFFLKLNFFLELHVSLDNPFVSDDKYTSKDFWRPLTLMSSSINILSYDITSNGLGLFFFFHIQLGCVSSYKQVRENKHF